MSTLQKLADLLFQVNNTHMGDPLDIDDLSEWLEIAFEGEPIPFCQRIDRLIDIYGEMISQPDQYTLFSSTSIINFIASIIIKYPKLTKNKKVRCTKLFNNYLATFSKTSSVIEDQWYNPPNGYSEDNDEGLDDNRISEKILMDSFDDVLLVTGRKLASSWLLPLFEGYMVDGQDWRKPYAAMMLASQLSGNDMKVANIDKFVSTALIYCQNPHPKLRYASLHLIGQHSEQIKPDFQEKYFDVVVPPILRLMSDPVPRIVAHSFACFTNFFEDIEQVWKVESVIGQVIPAAVHHLKTGNTWVQQCSIALLSSMATTANAFGPNLTQILEIGNEIIVTFAGIAEYKQLVGQAFELLSITLSVQQKSYVEQYVPNFVNLLIAHKQNILKSYFTSALQRICMRYEYFTDITTLFGIVFQLAKYCIYQNEDNQDAEESLLALSHICKSFKEKMKPYAEELFAFAKLNFEDKDKSLAFRENSIRIIQNLVVFSKSETPGEFQAWKGFAFEAIKFYALAIESLITDNFDQAEVLFNGLEKIIICVIPYLEKNQIEELALRLRKRIEANHDMYLTLSISNVSLQDEAEDQILENEEEMAQIKANINTLLQSIFFVPDVFGSMLKISDEQSKAQLIAFIYQQASNYIDKAGEWKLYAFNLLGGLLEECLYAELFNCWQQIELIYVENCSNPHTRIRNCSAYGLGMIALGTPAEFIDQAKLIGWLEALWKSLTQPFQEDLSEYYSDFCRQNTASALGKILHKLGNKFPAVLNKQVYEHWFSLLPLNTDKVEGDIQQEYLIELLESNPGMLVANKQDLGKVCIVYASFLIKRQNYKNKEIIDRTKQSLQAITKWPLFKEAEDYLWSTLTHSQINALTRLLSN